MSFYFFPLLAAGMGWLFTRIVLALFLNRTGSAGFTFKNRIRSIKPELAREAGKYAAAELLRFNISADQTGDRDLISAIQPDLGEKVDLFLREKLPQKWPMISMFLNEQTREKIKSGLMEELESMLPSLLQKLTGALEERVDIRGIVEQRIRAWPESQIQDILEMHMGGIFRMLCLAGMFLGFLIGLAALCFFSLLPA